MKSAFRDAWRLTAPYWKSKEKWIGLLLLAAIVGTNLGQVYLSVQFNMWRNGFYDTLQNYDWNGFVAAIIKFSWLAAIAIVLYVYGRYLLQMLTIRWRRWLTDFYLDQWLSHGVYYRLQVEGNPSDNPDQRIADDIKQFVELTLDLSLGLLSSIVTFFSFLGILWGLSGDFTIPGTAITVPGYMVWVALLYAIAGTFFTRWIGRPLAGLNYDQQRYEADFRYSLIRLRENAESVAFYKGENPEKEVFRQRFVRLFDNFWEIMRRQKRLNWFASGYDQVAEIFPYLVVAPRFFAKAIKLGDLMQTAEAFSQVKDALSYIVSAYFDIARWRAVIERLTGFMENMSRLMAEIDAPDAFRPGDSGGNEIAASGLELRLPDGRELQKELHFSVKEGESLLIQGPSGCGKSTLLRTMAGIWPYAHGKLVIPANANTLFVPQKPYLPLGRLRDGLVYPGTADIGDEELHRLMRKCQLDHFIPRLDEVQPWGQMLSLGEQQRVAFLRAFLMKQDVIFLDEATSALDEDAEAYFYELLRKKLPKAVIVSVGHRSTLEKWHDRKLNLGTKKK